jgi:hypothetical protein
MVVHDGAQIGEALHKADWQNGITDPQGREQDLAHRADIDNPARRIQAVQARQWRPCVAKLGIVVVFDNPGVEPRRQIDKRQPPGNRQASPGRKLACGRGVNEGRNGSRPGRRNDSVRIDSRRLNERPSALPRGARAKIPGCGARRGQRDRRRQAVPPDWGGLETGELFIYKQTRAGPSLQVALADQPVAGRDHRVAGHAQIKSQFPAGWQRLARRERAGLDDAFQAEAQLCLQ